MRGVEVRRGLNRMDLMLPLYESALIKPFKMALPRTFKCRDKKLSIFFHVLYLEFMATGETKQ